MVPPWRFVLLLDNHAHKSESFQQNNQPPIEIVYQKMTALSGAFFYSSCRGQFEPIHKNGDGRGAIDTVIVRWVHFNLALYMRVIVQSPLCSWHIFCKDIWGQFCVSFYLIQYFVSPSFYQSILRSASHVLSRLQ